MFVLHSPVCIAAESYKDTQMVKIKEEPMEVEASRIRRSQYRSCNVSYSTLIGREKTEPLQKLPERQNTPEKPIQSGHLREDGI